MEDRIRLWSKPEDWTSGTVPVDGDNVEIETNWQMKVDVVTAAVNKLTINGKLMFDNKDNLKLKAKIIVIEQTGQLYIGSETTPYAYKSSIELAGVRADPQEQISSTINPVNKGIIVKGKLFINAEIPTLTQSRL